MTQSILHHGRGSAEVRLGRYNGVETVTAFTDPTSELRALTSSCGIFDLEWRAKIAVRGRDRVRWLNGMVTNTIKDLPVDRGNYSFVLNPQGRILGDLYAYNREEYLVLDTDRSQAEILMNNLKRFIIMDQVELENLSESLKAIGLCGPNSEKILGSSGMDVSHLQPLQVREVFLNGISTTLVRGPEQKPHWWEIWTGCEQIEKILDILVNGGAQAVGTEALELWRILQGVPKYGQDIRDRDLPQETEQMQALNFTKGCYIGQEIVERIRSRGQVHRRFIGLQFPDALPQPGKFEENGKVVAEITSTAQIGARKIGLGYVRRETGEPGSQLSLSGIAASISSLPFPIE
jgi:folate-binding protein YgfZ